MLRHRPRGFAQDAFRASDYRAIYHFAVHENGSSSGALGGIDYFIGPGDFFRRGAETFVHDRDLFRMNAQLSAEAEADSALRVGADEVGGIDGGCDSVDWRENFGEAGEENELRAEEKEFVVGDAEVELQIEMAEDESLYTGAARDFGDVRDPFRGFDQREKIGGKMARYFVNMIGTFCFGDHDRGGFRTLSDVFAEPFGIDGVDADNHAGFEIRERSARGRFFGWRDGVFEIDNNGVGTGGESFFETVGAGGGDEKIGTRDRGQGIIVREDTTNVELAPALTGAALL